jgi:hypothetical protein
MTTAELIYQHSRELPEAEAKSVLDFIEFLTEKLRRNTARQQAAAIHETATEQRLTGVVGELAGLLKDKEVDASREARTAHLEEKYR